MFKYGYQALIQQQYIDGAGFTEYPADQYYPNPTTGLPDPTTILQTDQYNFEVIF